MKTLCLALAVVSVIVLLSGCSILGIGIGIRTNISLPIGNGLVMLITNNSNYVVTITVDGDDQELTCPEDGRPLKKLQPGERGRIRKTTLRDHRECLMVATAWDENGRLVEVDEKKCEISSDHFHSESWTLRNSNFAKKTRDSWNRGDGHGH